MKRVGIIGAGPMGRLHARTVQAFRGDDGDYRLARILDRHGGRASALCAEFGGEPCVDLDAFAAQVDVAIVAVPTSAHLSTATRLLEAGLDLLVEKPLAASVEEGATLLARAEHAGRILQVGHVEWYNPAWREAAAKVGDVRRIQVDRLQPKGDRGRDIDVVQDLMLHDLDWATRWLDHALVELAATGQRGPEGRLERATARLTLAGGRVIELRASRMHPERLRTARFEGSRGIATADLDRRPGPATGSEVDPLERQWADFVTACRTRSAPTNDGRVGLEALRWVERVRAAIARQPGGSDLADDPRLRR